jgi:hypothetical protein
MRHVVIFDDATGALEYRIDGRLESIAYLTDTGGEGGTVYQPVIGAPSDLRLCPAFSGAVDDLRISREARQIPYEDDFVRTSGTHQNLYPRDANARFESPAIPAAKGSLFQSLEALADVPDETGVQFFVRAGKDPHFWTASEPAWVPVQPHSAGIVSNNSSAGQPIAGDFFQVAASLYADGAGTKTPRVTQVTLTWFEAMPPLPPFALQAAPGDGSVTLTWTAPVDNVTEGYLVYYGERPGEYLGRAALEGPSPIDAGNSRSFQVKGLQNGRIYYFAVAAVSKADKGVLSELSQEIYARPFPGGST